MTSQHTGSCIFNAHVYADICLVIITTFYQLVIVKYIKLYLPTSPHKTCAYCYFQDMNICDIWMLSQIRYFCTIVRFVYIPLCKHAYLSCSKK